MKLSPEEKEKLRRFERMFFFFIPQNKQMFFFFEKT